MAWFGYVAELQKCAWAPEAKNTADRGARLISSTRHPNKPGIITSRNARVPLVCCW